MENKESRGERGERREEKEGYRRVMVFGWVGLGWVELGRVGEVSTGKSNANFQRLLYQDELPLDAHAIC